MYTKLIKQNYNIEAKSIQIMSDHFQTKTFLVESGMHKLQHIKRISSIEFDCDKLTYINSHGDYYINQIIVQNKELVIIDWTDAFYLPACFEVMMPYLTYYYLCFCCFTPPYIDLSSDYLQIAKLSDYLKNWLYKNVDDLSRDLCE